MGDAYEAMEATRVPTKDEYRRRAYKAESELADLRRERDEARDQIAALKAPTIEQIARLEAEIKTLRRTACVDCGHYFGEHLPHWRKGACAHEDYVVGERPKHCRCKKFVDPVPQEAR
jgi:hypothetical protein